MNDFLDQTKKEVEKRVDRAVGRVSEVKDAVIEKIEHAKDAVTDTAGEAREYVRKNPEKSAGIALGVGAFFGAIVGFFTGRKK